MDKNLGNRIAIVKAMTDLIRMTSLDKMTIASICEKSTLSKATFYRLFPSKFDVIRWVMEIYSKIGLDEIGRTLNWHEGLSRTTLGLDKHSALIKAANQTKQFFEAPKEFAYNRRKDVLIETIRDWHRAEVTERLAFQAKSYARLSTIIASEWHRGLYEYSETEYIDLLESIVPYELHELLNEPITPERKEPKRAEFNYNYENYSTAKAMLDFIATK